MGQPVLVAYISGHGFGHFVRSAAVLSLLRGVQTHLRTNGRALFLAERARWAASVTEVDVGPGVVQRGPLESDLPATRASLQRHLDDWQRQVDAEAAFLRRSGAALVYGDIPPLAFAAAAAAGVPSVALANFSWSWIYASFAGDDPWFAGAAAQLRRAEEQADLLLELAMGGGLDHFPRRQAIAPIARALSRTRAQIRASAPVFAREARTFVLFSLGGFGGDLEVPLHGSSAHHLIVSSGRVLGAPEDVTFVEPSDQLPQHELVAAVDCVIGKPGYGTIAECLRQPTPLCWLPRGDFCEAPPLIEAIERWLPSSPIALSDLRDGRWSQVVDAAIASSPREPAPAPDGAEQACALLQSRLR